MNRSLPSDGLPLRCGVFHLLGGSLPSSVTEVKALLIFLAVISIVTLPFTAALTWKFVPLQSSKKKAKRINFFVRNDEILQTKLELERIKFKFSKIAGIKNTRKKGALYVECLGTTMVIGIVNIFIT